MEESSSPQLLILTINGGSSSVKFAAYPADALQERCFSGQAERIGTSEAHLAAAPAGSSVSQSQPISGATFDNSVQAVVSYIRSRIGPSAVAGIGHRIVQGGMHLQAHQLVTDDLIAELRRTQPLDMPHLPSEIALLEQFRAAFPGVPQVACFDTAFHRDLPRIAQLLPIPRRYLDAGLRRFGFHGLSYTYLMGQLAAVGGRAAADGRVILAHLGSGASMAAVHGGKPIDTTMGFTPMAGLMMATRPGDFDPGLLIYLMKDQNLSPDQAGRFISEQCGLRGVSGGSADMRDLQKARATDPHAAEAIDLFCHLAKKQLCGLTGVLGGLETLVFAGGIGEHAPQVRAQICEGLGFLGLQLDEAKNAAGHDVISASGSRVTVRVIATDEEAVIAQTVREIALQTPGK